MKLDLPWNFLAKLIHKIGKLFIKYKFIPKELKNYLPAIFVFNHNNYFETFLIPAYLMYELGNESISFVIDWMFAELPLVRNLLYAISPVLVYNKKPRLTFQQKRRRKLKSSVIEECLKRLAENRSIGIFPEGSRNNSAVYLKKAKKGIGHIVLRSKAPVIPIGIKFSSPKGSLTVPSIGRFSLIAGQPLFFSNLGEIYKIIQLNVHDQILKHKAFETLANLVTHEIMTNLAQLSGKSYNFSLPDLSIFSKLFSFLGDKLWTKYA